MITDASVLRALACRDPSCPARPVVLDLLTRIGELEVATQTDPLTGILNRRGLRTQWTHWSTAWNDTPGGVAMVDVDHFKSINDRHGHDGGDLVLQHVAEHLEDVGLAARLGGDEFAVLLPPVPDPSAAIGKAVDAIGVPLEIRPQEQVRVELSVGYVDGAEVGNPGDHTLWLSALLRAADARLYLAKQSGRGTILGPHR